MAKGDLIRNAVEAMIVVGKDVVPAGNLLFEVGKWLFDKYKEHKVNKRLEDLEEGAKIKPQEAVQIAREEIQRQRQNGKTISGEFERQLVERAAMMPAMVNQHIQATLQQAQRHGTQAVDALPIGDHIRENERTAFYQSLIPPRAPQFHKGDKLPHYNPQWKLVEMLGSGGFGEVWQVEHTISKKSFAVKFCLDEQSAKLLKREANALMELSQKLPDHPNIVDLKDIQLEEQPYWLMFEQINGGTLHSLMQAKQLTVQESLDLFVPIVEAMVLVHQAGIIHRDLKPANILLTVDNIPKIADFGIGKIIAEQTALTRQTKSLFTAMGYGTAGYMSPEQSSGLPAHFSDDVYSLGVILWQMLSHTLQPPHFLRNSLKKLSISDEMKNLLLSCIEEPREERIQNAGELLQQFELICFYISEAKKREQHLEKERREQEALERQRREHEKKVQEEQTRLAKEREKLERERLEQEKREREQKEREKLEQQRREHDKKIQEDHAHLAKQHKELARQQREQERLEQQRKACENDKGTPRTFSTMSAGKQVECTVYEKTFDIKGIPLVMVYIPQGTFQMGSNIGHNSEKPVHSVEIKKAFYMGKYPIIQKQWQAIMGSNPSHSEGANLPVDKISWNQAKEFCEKLSQLLKQEFRLPTEAEWEYACRAGSSTEWSFGDNKNELKNYAWYGMSGIHEVGEKKPNAFGLYDMHGNVCEWCEDVWHSDYDGAPNDGSAWTKGGNFTERRRLLRGGKGFGSADNCRSARCFGNTPDNHDYYNGLRVVSLGLLYPFDF